MARVVVTTSRWCPGTVLINPSLQLRTSPLHCSCIEVCLRCAVFGLFRVEFDWKCVGVWGLERVEEASGIWERTMQQPRVYVLVRSTDRLLDSVHREFSI